MAVDKGDVEDEEGENVDDPVLAALRASMVAEEPLLRSWLVLRNCTA